MELFMLVVALGTLGIIITLVAIAFRLSSIHGTLVDIRKALQKK